MSEDETMKLFKYIEDMRREMNAGFEENRREHADIRGAIAELAAQVRDYHQEVLAMSK